MCVCVCVCVCMCVCVCVHVCVCAMCMHTYVGGVHAGNDVCMCVGFQFSEIGFWYRIIASGL